MLGKVMNWAFAMWVLNAGSKDLFRQQVSHHIGGGAVLGRHMARKFASAVGRGEALGVPMYESLYNAQRRIVSQCIVQNGCIVDDAFRIDDD